MAKLTRDSAPSWHELVQPPERHVPRIKTGPWYEHLASLPTLNPVSIAVTTRPCRSDRRRAEHQERKAQGRKRQRYYTELQDYVLANFRGTKLRKDMIHDQMAKVSREAWAGIKQEPRITQAAIDMEAKPQ
ncbi:MAG: hypothetical protein M3O41_14330 [Pseudomonadota bacterium]|nr:hypothetical protein [Pseudomonadota bacterium]